MVHKGDGGGVWRGPKSDHVILEQPLWLLWKQFLMEDDLCVCKTDECKVGKCRSG